MIHKIRTSKFSKVIASYLAIQLILTTVQPTHLFALTGGPAQPEFNSFTPIGTSDMVNLSSGDFNYNIPIMDVGGYPLNLAYNSGVTMDQEASWVGLGWNLNVGQINRQVRGLPDDFDGDEIRYENDMKKNKTIGMTVFLNPQLLGFELGNVAGNQDDSSIGAKAALTIQHNNYTGFTVRPSLGFSFDFANIGSVGMDLTSSSTDGVTISPSVGFSKRKGVKDNAFGLNALTAGINFGTSYNSLQGLTSINVGTSINGSFKKGTNTSLSRASGNISLLNETFTPNKRAPIHNKSSNLDVSVGFDIWGIDAEVGASAFATSQHILDENKDVLSKAYGYEFTKNANKNSVLDFNRENDNTITQNTLVLPLVNYTYDLYNIQGQGVGGQFRPFKSQAGQVFDQFIRDTGNSDNFGGELEIGTGIHVGFDYKNTNISNHTGKWDTPTSDVYFSTATNQDKDYENTYFKAIGDLGVDQETDDLFIDKLGGDAPINIDIVPNGVDFFNKYPGNVFNKKTAENTFDQNGEPTAVQIPITSKIHREKRERRNKAIQKINNKDAEYDPMVKTNTNAKDHHTVGVKVLNPDGSKYVYGESVYNKEKVEAVFATDGVGDPNYMNGTIIHDSNNSEQGLDHYYNKITTPGYSHSYLLTSVLSTDYEDLTNDGPTDDDLGAYTKIHYNDFSYDEPNSQGEVVESISNNYKWRVPFQKNEASYNPGLYTRHNDQKGSYTEGTKELKYASIIETKTHVAVFDFDKRSDALGSENTFANHDNMLRISKIKLYSKPEFKNAIQNAVEGQPLDVSPIKTAHFEYDYSLCKNVENNFGDPDFINGQNVNVNNGKLTLKKVYFTYRDSKMGEYTPYVFNYDNFNPDYQIKSHDVWGNYKPIFEDAVLGVDDENISIPDLENSINAYNNNSSNTDNCEVNNPITAQEYPFVKQDNQNLQNIYASAWSMSSIDLPSGGKINVEYESDDYQYVQDKNTMQMFKVEGVIDNNISDDPSLDDLIIVNDDFDHPALYSSDKEGRYLVVELPGEEPTINEQEFQDKYLGSHIDNPIAFKFLLNMTKDPNCNFEYVTGYFKIKKEENGTHDFRLFVDEDTEKVYACIPMAWSKMEKGNGTKVNPISKAGWFFGRTNLPKRVYGSNNSDNPIDDDTGQLEDFIWELENSFGSFIDIAKAPNYTLRTEEFIARHFIPEKSWIRLQTPNKTKLGGGLRVSKVSMDDNWDLMTNSTGANSDLYKMNYGQVYNYNLTNGKSSGVASFEPNASRENPFVEPFYKGKEPGLAPKELNYVEKPFGKSFFPSPSVTYSRVEVKNLPRERTINGQDVVLTKHATGHVVNEFFTTKNFPTIVDRTNIDLNYKSNNGSLLNALISSISKIKSKTELVASQGFSVITNDMNGKTKKQEVFDEHGNLISGVTYNYNIDENGQLDNQLKVIFKDGTIGEELIGQHYDVVSDFRENINETKTKGLSANTATLPFVFPIIIPLGLFNNLGVKNQLKTVTTTKVIHKSGILKEKIAYDLGSRVNTQNIAWDAENGQVLLTQTTNEYDDNYYNFTYPAYWAYKGMGQAINNLNLETWIKPIDAENFPDGHDASGDEDLSTAWYTLANANPDETIEDYFNPGDEVYIYDDAFSPPTGKLWVLQVDPAINGMILMDRSGQIINVCGYDGDEKLIKIVRSSYRNLQTASMASVTSMLNPLSTSSILTAFDYNDSSSANPKIINASAVEYQDYWRDTGDRELTQVNDEYPQDSQLNSNHLVSYPQVIGFNPYVHNILGDWRAIKSYAYLTDREVHDNPRKQGFFTSFMPLYAYNPGLEQWVSILGPTQADDEAAKWTFASEVSKYSATGAEVENKDALNRYSSAQYGYNYTLPTAVASNNRYRDMGFDGFEDYFNYQGNENQHFRSQVKAYVSSEEAHTGKYSFKVAANSMAIVNSTSLQDASNVSLQTLDCSPTSNPICHQPREYEIHCDDIFRPGDNQSDELLFLDGNFLSHGDDGAGDIFIEADSANDYPITIHWYPTYGEYYNVYWVNLNGAPNGDYPYIITVTDSDDGVCTTDLIIKVLRESENCDESNDSVGNGNN